MDMTQKTKAPSTAARIAANFFSYVAPVATIVFYLTGLHIWFLCFGAAVFVFELVILFAFLVYHDTWMAKLIPLFQLIPWILVGCLISHWNILEGLLLGQSMMVFMGEYMHAIDGIFCKSEESSE